MAGSECACPSPIPSGRFTRFFRKKQIFYKNASNAKSTFPVVIPQGKKSKSLSKSEYLDIDKGKESVQLKLSKKFWKLINREIYPVLNDPKLPGNLKGEMEDLKIKRQSINHLIKVWGKSEDEESAAGYSGADNNSINHEHEREKNRNSFKSKLRRQLWSGLKYAIKGNEYWTDLMIENNINIDNINIDEVDLSLIDVDALGIENKFLKRTLIWLFK